MRIKKDDIKHSESNAEDLLNYVLQHKMSILFVWIYTILIYGVWCAQNLVTFDAEGFFDRMDGQDWYNQWYQMGRWSMVLFKDILHVNLINPFFQIVMFGIFFPASVILWWFCFYRWNRNQEPRFGLLLFSGIYISHPIWATQFAYRNQIESITFLMCLMPIALLLLTDHRPEGRGSRVIISAILTVICFGGYQSFFFLYGEGLIIYLLYRLYYDYSPNERKNYWNEVLFLFAFTLVCFATNSVISRLLCAMRGLTYGTEYLRSQFRWGSYPISENLSTIAEYLRQSLLSNNMIYNWIGIIEIIAGIILIYYSFRGRLNEGILGMLLFVASWITPFALLFVTAFPTVHRSQFCFVLTLAFWGTIEIGVLFYYLSRKRLSDARILLMALIMIFTIFPQIQKNTRLLYTDYMTMYLDEVQLRTIYYQSLAKGAHEGDPIVILNGKSNYTTDAMAEQEVIGFSYFEFNGLYGEDKIVEAMRAYGMNVSSPTDEQRTFATAFAKNMDTWPRAGGIAVEKGIIIVKLEGN